MEYCMNEEQRKEYAESLKTAAKEFIDGIGTESERDQRIIKLIYGFSRSGFLESRAEKGSYGVPDSVDYLTDREHHSGSSIDLQVK